MVIPSSKVIEAYPGIETLLEDPPEKREDRVRMRWVMTLYDPVHHGQGRSVCRCRAWEVTGIDYFYEMEPRMSKKLADDVQGELKYVLENMEPEEVRRRYERRAQ